MRYCTDFSYVLYTPTHTHLRDVDVDVSLNRLGKKALIICLAHGRVTREAKRWV